MYYSIGPGLGPTSLRDDEFRPVFWSEVFRRVLVSDAYKPKDWNKIAKVIPIFAIGIAIGIATTS